MSYRSITGSTLLVLLLGSGLAARAAGDDPPPGIVPIEQRKQVAKIRKKPPLVKLIRPGISGVATLPPVHGCLLVENFSREANAAGVSTTGMTGFVECALSKHIGISAAPTHWTLKSGVNGFGDIAFGPKVTVNNESRYVPLMSIGYVYKQPSATHNLGSGFADHKLLFYADKNIGSRRITADYIAKWEGHSGGYVRQDLESLALLTPIYGRIGLAAQAFYATSSLARYGGAVAAAAYSFRPNLTAHAGVEHGFGPKSANLGLVWGLSYMYLGPKPRH